MADRKCTDLTALAAGSQATGDLLMIVDVSEAAATDKNKKITVESLFKGIPGDVGIGTASPVANTPLTLQGSSGYTDTLWLKSIGTNIDSRINFGPTGTGDAQINNATGTDIAFQVSGSEKLRIDSSGNVGIGVTPNTHSLGKALEIGAEGNVLWGEGAGNIHLLSNAYYNGGYKYATSAPAGRYNIYQNTHTWARASSGTADAAATFTESMRISSSGQVMIGTTTAGSGDADDLTVATSGHGGITIRSGSSHAAAIYFADGTSGSQNYQGIVQYLHSADELQFYVNYAGNSNPRMRIDSSGNVGIDFTPKSMHANVTSSLNVGSSSLFQRSKDTYISSNFYYNSSDVGKSIATGYAPIYVQDVTNGAHKWFQTNSASAADETVSLSEKMRLDSSGRLLVGTSTGGSVARLQVQGSTIFNDAFVDICYNGSAASGIASGTNLGVLRFTDQASNANIFAQISCAADAAASSGDYPGRLIFSTTADGASSSTERMRIDSSGNVGITNSAYLGFNGASDETHSIQYDSGIDGVEIRGQNGIKFTTASGSGTERMRISSSGRLGVGSNSPEVLFHPSSANNDHLIFADARHSSYTNQIQTLRCGTNASSAWKFFQCESGCFGGTFDIEFNLRGDGNAYADGSWNGGGADYAEYFEWSDGNTEAEDRRGISVVLDGDKIREAVDGEEPIGVISGNPSVVGDAAWNHWNEKYVRDDYGSYVLDGNGHRQVTAEYNSETEYTSREERPEWSCVGLMGKLRIRKGQVTGARWIKMRDVSASVEEWLVR